METLVRSLIVTAVSTFGSNGRALLIYTECYHMERPSRNNEFFLEDHPHQTTT